MICIKDLFKKLRIERFRGIEVNLKNKINILFIFVHSAIPYTRYNCSPVVTVLSRSIDTQYNKELQ
jgi:hypothetical protein